MIRQIIQHPDPSLKRVSQPLGEINDAVRKLAGDLIDTMNGKLAWGLSAIQVGVPVRMFAISGRTKCPFKVLINPEIVSYSSDTVMSKEGCLSINQGIPQFMVRRSKAIKVHAITRRGEKVHLEVVGGAALCMQHEIDHLDGKLVLDYAELLIA